MTFVGNYGPRQGKKGMPVNLIGNGFSTLSNITIKFGPTPVAISLGGKNNDQHLQADVPDVNGRVALILQATGIPGGSEFVGGFDAGTAPDYAVTDVYPRDLPVGGGVKVSIYGNGFVTFGQNAAPDMIFQDATVKGSVVNETLIEVVAPSSTAANIDPGVPFAIILRFGADNFLATPYLEYV